jgi:small-conductance mechanosensitive channel
MLERTLYGSVTVMDLLVAVGIIIAGVLLAKVLSLYLKRHLRERLGKFYLDLAVKLSTYTIVLGAVFAVFPLLGINLSGLLVAGGITGIVLGLASQSIVSNLISGIFLMVERPVKVGQQVNIENVTGYVEDIHIISTIVRTYDGLFVRMPNERVFTSNITNYVANVVRRFEYMVGIRYSDDANKAIRIIKDLIEAHPMALVKPKPQVFVDSLGDNAVNIAVRIWAPAAEWYELKMEMLWKIKRALEREGIQVPFPQRTLWYGDRQALQPGAESEDPEAAGAG